MALTATFTTDFSDFYEAVQKAEVHLKGFETTSSKVQSQLTRMTDAFSGRPLIQQATLMAEAMERAGGITKLTDTELRRLAATTNEAAEKMRKMGQEVPKSFDDIGKAAANVKAPTESWGSTLTNVTNIIKGFMALQVVGWFKDAANATLAYADTLSNLSATTGVSLQGLQRLEAIGVTSGVSIDALAKSIFVLQKNLDSPAAQKALKEMGLDFQRIRSMDPEEMFLTTAKAVAQIDDPVRRANAGSALFARTWQEISPAIQGDIQDVIDKVKMLEDEEIESLDKAGDALDLWYLNAKKTFDSYLGNLARVANETGSTWMGIARAFNNFPILGAQIDKYVQSIEKLRKEREAMAKLPDLPAAPGVRIYGPAAPLDVDELLAQQAAGTEAQKKATAAAEKRTEAMKDLTGSIVPLTAAEKALVDQWVKQGAQAGTVATAFGLNARAVEQYTAAQKALQTVIPTTNVSMAKFTELVSARQLQSGLQQIQRDTEALTDTLENFTGRFKGAEMFPEVPATTLESWKKTQTAMTETMPMMMTLGSNMRDFISKDLGKIVVSGITGGGSAVKGALTGFGQTLFAKDGAFGKSITSGISSVFGKDGAMGKIASSLGDMVPVIGSLIGPAIEGVTMLFKKVFGKSEETSKVSPLRDEFFKLQGGLEALNPRVMELSGNLSAVQAVFDAKTVEQYNAAIANLNALFQQETDALALLTSTAEKYGFTIEELGPAMQRQKLDEQAQALFKDWEILNAAGIDTVAITKRMATSVNAYVNQAIAMGTEVPEAMRPMLTKMIEMGQLTDASGNKINNLEDSGLSFSMTMSKGFQALITEVQKLTDLIGRSLGTAVDDTTAKIKKIPTKVGVEVHYRSTGTVPKGGSDEEPPGFQTGTHGKFVDFGKGSLVMLHGREAVVPEGDVAPLSGGSGSTGGASGVTVHIDARGALFNDPGSDQRLASLVERALSAKHGLTHRRRAA